MTTIARSLFPAAFARTLVAALVAVAALGIGWRAASADCWLYCQSKDPPPAFVEALGALGKFAVDHGIPVRTVNKLGGRLIGGGYAPGSEAFTVSGTHLTRAGVITITVELVGGGGGGGKGPALGNYSSGAGGGGASKGALTVAPYQPITVTIGAGGTPGAGGGEAGTPGGTTTVSSISATGGSPGSISDGAPAGGSGSGGSLYNRTGGSGFGTGAGTGGGGGAAGSTGNGGSASSATGGTSGGSPGGTGGTTCGSDPTNYGAGGQGGAIDSCQPAAGTPGYANITW